MLDFVFERAICPFSPQLKSKPILMAFGGVEHESGISIIHPTI